MPSKFFEEKMNFFLLFRELYFEYFVFVGFTPLASITISCRYQ